jgi:hypothetical protein
MIIGVLSIELEIPDAYSLKDKRAALNRLRDRVRRKFNVAVAEVEDNELWNHSVVAVVAVSNQQRFCNQVLSKAGEFIETLPDCIVEGVSLEFI